MIKTPRQPVIPLTLLGDMDAAACEGDVCELPGDSTSTLLDRRRDDASS